jgi:hypothetical protein
MKIAWIIPIIIFVQCADKSEQPCQPEIVYLTDTVTQSITEDPMLEINDNSDLGSTDYDNFKQTAKAKFKVNYFNTEGYSHGDRHWHEIIIIDSLLILNFRSPYNDDWSYINYQKQEILDKETLADIKAGIINAGLEQKKEGFPEHGGSGYGADRLYIEYEELDIAGGTTYACVGKEETDEAWMARINAEIESSSTLSGDYLAVFEMLEELFTDLPNLMRSKDRIFD